MNVKGYIEKLRRVVGMKICRKAGKDSTGIMLKKIYDIKVTNMTLRIDLISRCYETKQIGD